MPSGDGKRKTDADKGHLTGDWYRHAKPLHGHGTPRLQLEIPAELSGTGATLRRNVSLATVLRRGQRIGGGTFGLVHRATLSFTSKPVSRTESSDDDGDGVTSDDQGAVAAMEDDADAHDDDESHDGGANPDDDDDEGGGGDGSREDPDRALGGGGGGIVTSLAIGDDPMDVDGPLAPSPSPPPRPRKRPRHERPPPPPSRPSRQDRVQRTVAVKVFRISSANRLRGYNNEVLFLRYVLRCMAARDCPRVFPMIYGSQVVVVPRSVLPKATDKRDRNFDDRRVGIIVMEMLPGQTVTGMSPRQRAALTLTYVKDLLLLGLRTLQFLHERQIYLQDLSGRNTMVALGDRKVWLWFIDFNYVSVGPRSPLKLTKGTHCREGMGTEPYMAPERLFDQVRPRYVGRPRSPFYPHASDDARRDWAAMDVFGFVSVVYQWIRRGHGLVVKGRRQSAPTYEILSGQDHLLAQYLFYNLTDDDTINQLLLHVLCFDPRKRPSAAEAAQGIEDSWEGGRSTYLPGRRLCSPDGDCLVTLPQQIVYEALRRGQRLPTPRRPAKCGANMAVVEACQVGSHHTARRIAKRAVVEKLIERLKEDVVEDMGIGCLV
jgi:serine/threonine protein kinase